MIILGSGSQAVGCDIFEDHKILSKEYCISIRYPAYQIHTIQFIKVAKV